MPSYRYVGMNVHYDGLPCLVRVQYDIRRKEEPHMTNEERNIVLKILDDEWVAINKLDMNDKPSLIQYAAAIWTILEHLPFRYR